MLSRLDELIAEAAAKRTARTDPAEHTHKAPAGYKLKGVSTLLRADGSVAQTWVKTTAEQETAADVLDAFQVAVSERDIEPAATVAPSATHNADLLTVYPMGDPHIGMLAWGAETGADFDLKIAVGNLTAAVDRLVSLAPASETALIVNLGDYYHADNPSNRTARSGNALDVDSRWAKILRAGIACQIRCIDRALERHASVRVINEIGNHDDMSSVMLSVCLDHHYRNEPRVQIDTSPSTFHWYRHGLCFLGVTHGHNTKAQALPGIMAYDKPQEWGATRYRHFYTGHVHHESVKEYPGCTVETFRTLAARDAWHHASGYRAGRSMVCDVWHAKRGRILRHEVGVEALEGGDE